MTKSKTDLFPEESMYAGMVFDFFKPHSREENYDWGPSMTRQEFAEDCDINTIMSRYETTGVLHAPFQKGELHYADYSEVPDLMTAMAVLEKGQADFMSLPARVRREFDNDPVRFVEFASDPANLDQMRQWNLAMPAPAERPPVADRPISELTASEFADLTREAPKPA